MFKGRPLESSLSFSPQLHDLHLFSFLWDIMCQLPVLLSFSVGPSPATGPPLLLQLLLRHLLPLAKCLSTLSNVLGVLQTLSHLTLI